MADQTSPALSQLPTMPTAPGLGVNQNANTPAAPGAASAIGRFMTQPFTGAPPVITPQPPAAPKANPALENGVLPAVATLAAQRRWGAGGPDSGTDAGGQAIAASPPGSIPTAPASPAAALDPLSGQIHFVDQNSPKVGGGQMPPQIIRAGMVSGEGSGLRNIDVQHMAALVQPRQSPQEIAQHEILAEEQQLSTARMQLEGAQKVRDTSLASDAQKRINALTHSSRNAYIKQRQLIAFPGIDVPTILGGGG